MSSSIPAAVANLVTIITAALPPATVVNVGPDLPRYVARQTFELLGVTGDQSWREMGPTYKREEIYGIHCRITAWEGNQDWSTRFVEVMALFEDITIAVANNPWLSTSGFNDSTAAVRVAEVGNMQLTPVLQEKGSTARLEFDVRCSQRVTSLT